MSDAVNSRNVPHLTGTFSTPCTVIPVIVFLYMADKKAIALGELNLTESLYARRYKELHDGEVPDESIFSVFKRAVVEIDAFG